ncbi:MAG: hypothetical protein AAGF55_09980 [Pseudomonadota bacterium]
MKLPLLVGLFAVAATPVFAEHVPFKHHWIDPDIYDVYGELYRSSDELLEKPLKLVAFLEWTAISYPTADNVVVLNDRTIRIGSGVYNN